jgi:hypothetical protein
LWRLYEVNQWRSDQGGPCPPLLLRRKIVNVIGNCHVTLTKIKFIIIIIIIIIIENEIEESAEVLGRILVQNGNLIRRNSKRRKREVRMPQRSQFSTKMEILRRQVAKIRAKCRSYDPRERCYESRER